MITAQDVFFPDTIKTYLGPLTRVPFVSTFCSRAFFSRCRFLHLFTLRIIDNFVSVLEARFDGTLNDSQFIRLSTTCCGTFAPRFRSPSEIYDESLESKSPRGAD